MSLSFSLSSLARASFVALAMAASAAHAVDVSVQAGGSTIVDGIAYTLNPSNASRLTLGFDGLGVTNAFRGQVTATGAAQLATTLAPSGDYASITVDLPVSSVTGDSVVLGGDRYYGTKSYSHGGALTITVPKTFNGRRNVATNEGGSVTISNLHVDLPTLRVFADLTSGATTQTLALWNITSHDSGGMPVLPPDASVGAVASLHGLAFTTEGHDAFSQALTLSEFGKAALGGVRSFGTITTAVPEPSAWVMAVAGMVGVGALKRRRATTH